MTMGLLRAISIDGSRAAKSCASMAAAWISSPHGVLNAPTRGVPLTVRMDPSGPSLSTEATMFSPQLVSVNDVVKVIRSPLSSSS